MNKYNEIEIQTAKNLLKEGYKWLVRENYGTIYAYTDMPRKNHDWNNCVDSWKFDAGPDSYLYVCTKDVPIFQSIRFDDKEPTSLESIVHPQILDDAERKYLSAFIKPFRNNVTSIRKDKDMGCNTTRLRIVIYVSESGYCYLPWFNSGTMYKGMKLGHAYTLEELGL